DLDEGCARQAREAARDLGLPDAGRADHDDVLRDDLVAEIALDLLAAPAVAQRDRDRALRGALPDDVAVELGHHLARRHRARRVAARGLARVARDRLEGADLLAALAAHDALSADAPISSTTSWSLV